MQFLYDSNSFDHFYNQSCILHISCSIRQHQAEPHVRLCSSLQSGWTPRFISVCLHYFFNYCVIIKLLFLYWFVDAGSVTCKMKTFYYLMSSSCCGWVASMLLWVYDLGGIILNKIRKMSQFQFQTFVSSASFPPHDNSATGSLFPS